MLPYIALSKFIQKTLVQYCKVSNVYNPSTHSNTLNEAVHVNLYN